MTKNIYEHINSQKFNFVDYKNLNTLIHRVPFAIVYQHDGKVSVSKITRYWVDIYVLCCIKLYKKPLMK